MIFGTLAAAQALAPGDQEAGQELRKDISAECRAAYEALNLTR